jgi:Tfp pilus assembly protein PilX
MTYGYKHLVIPLAGLLIFGLTGSAMAQSAIARERAAANSAVAQGTANGTAAILKGENRTPNAVNTGQTARRRGAALSAGSADITPAAGAAPLALALEDAGPGPDSNPEPLTIIAIGGAMAGLYRMRRHLS